MFCQIWCESTLSVFEACLSKCICGHLYAQWLIRLGLNWPLVLAARLIMQMCWKVNYISASLFDPNAHRYLVWLYLRHWGMWFNVPGTQTTHKDERHENTLKPMHLDHPLVPDCSKTPSLSSLHYFRWHSLQTEYRNNFLNIFFQ